MSNYHNQVWAYETFAHFRDELTPYRLQALLKLIAEHEELRIAYWGRAAVQEWLQEELDDPNRVLNDEEWAQIIATHAWKRLGNTAHVEVGDSGVFPRVLREAKIVGPW